VSKDCESSVTSITSPLQPGAMQHPYHLITWTVMAMQVPTAPFVVASFAVGMFSLLPYFALWSPLPRAERVLPPKSELVSRISMHCEPHS
jgi:hypothetical protein